MLLLRMIMNVNINHQCLLAFIGNFPFHNFVLDRMLYIQYEEQYYVIFQQRMLIKLFVNRIADKT